MKTLEAIEARRSIKSFDPTFVIPSADVERLMDLAMLSPTSFNIQNWRMVVVQDAEQKAKLRAAAWGQAQVSEASLTILVCADLMAWNKSPERYWKDAPAETRDMLVPMITKFYGASESLQHDEAIRSIGIASQTIMLAAKSMGYDSCPMIGFDPLAVGKIIELPKDHLVGLMITVGKALKPAYQRSGQIDKSEIVFKDRFHSS